MLKVEVVDANEELEKVILSALFMQSHTRLSLLKTMKQRVKPSYPFKATKRSVNKALRGLYYAGQVAVAFGGSLHITESGRVRMTPVVRL